MMMTAQDEVLQMKKKVDDYGALRKKLARLELKERIEVATKGHPQHGLPTRHAFEKQQIEESREVAARCVANANELLRESTETLRSWDGNIVDVSPLETLERAGLSPPSKTCRLVPAP